MPANSTSIRFPMVSADWAAFLSPLNMPRNPAQDGVEEIAAQGYLRNTSGLALECDGDIFFLCDIRLNDHSVMPLFLRAPREYLQQYLRCHLASMLGRFARTLVIRDNFEVSASNDRYALQVHNHATGVSLQVAFNTAGSCLPSHLRSYRKTDFKLTDLPQIRLKTSATLDTFRLDTEELYSLQPGDVLLSKFRSHYDQCVDASVNGLTNAISARVRLGKNYVQFSFATPLTLERDIVTTSFIAAETSDSPGASDSLTREQNLHAEQSRGIDSVTYNPAIAAGHRLQLRCVVEGPAVELSELMSIRQGNVLELTQQVSCIEVDLCLGSHAIARGQLIDVEGTLGVRITKSYLPDSRTLVD